MTYQSINPFTQQTLRTFDKHPNAEVEKALARAHQAFSHWRNTSFPERSALMRAAAQQLRQRSGHYAQLMTDEMGKLRREAVAEVEKCALTCDFYAERAEQFLADETLAVEEGEAYLTYAPIGPVLAVMPWNFPFWQVIRFAAPALMAGNVGILKHAPNVPQCALALVDVFQEAGFPEGTFQNLFVSNDQVTQILADERIRAATLTGSERAGQAVAAKAGEQLKKTVLELGGSDPFVVLADADVQQAATVAVKARMQNSGQSCIAAKRFIVVREVADTFTEALVQQMKSLQPGDPNDEATDYAPLARLDLVETLQQQVDQSVAKGARVVLGGQRVASSEAFFLPTILTDIPPGCPAYNEELFGPVASLFVVGDEDEAVRLANDSPYGLGGSVWTQNKERGRAMAQRIESGAIYINKMMSSHPAVPFGGIKRSGYGRELSHLGIREFTNQKTVWVG